MSPPLSKRMKTAISLYIMDELTSCLLSNSITTNILISRYLLQQDGKYPVLLMIPPLRETHLRIADFYEQWIFEYLNHDFYKLFRMNKETYEFLLNELGAVHVSVRHGGRIAVPLGKSLMMTLWLLGKGDTYINISDRFNVTQSAAHRMVAYIISLLLKLRNKFICWPNQSERVKIARKFQEKSLYPGIIGAIDGCQIALKVPVEQQDSYINRKFFHSINLQGICSSNNFFTNIFVGFPGSAHDARVLQYSAIFRNVTSMGHENLFNHYHLVGDSAYPCLEWLMKPYRDTGRLTRSQQKHNRCLSSARVVIEHSFGLLKGRWRILKYLDVLSVEKGVQIITACVVLHNFCLIHLSLWDEVEDNIISEERDLINVSTMNELPGMRKRDAICRMLSE